jgi:hypothetical protein
VKAAVATSGSAIDADDFFAAAWRAAVLALVSVLVSLIDPTIGRGAADRNAFTNDRPTGLGPHPAARTNPH